MSLYKEICEAKIFFIAGPCVLDTDANAEKIAKKISELKQEHKVPFIFKASFDKANRQSIDSYRGVGFEKSAEILKRISKEYKLPILTDIHESYQAEHVDFADVIQIPAFLCRQTDLLVAAGKTKKIVNIKKGQFVSAEQMLDSAKKVMSTGNNNVLLTERGTFFGYGDLVVDFRNISKMKKTGLPVVFDATHSVQRPGGKGSCSGGEKEYIRPYASAAVEFGVNGIFMEVHPEPAKALCDGPNSLDLNELEEVVRTLLKRVKGER
jgi:2-dehydro-3-deoxyphosphooctonate aldolase (KDO 8-P synthase)